MSGIGRCEHFIFKLKISLKLLCIGLLKFVCLVCKLYLFTHFAISINLFVAQNKPHKKKNNKNDFSLNQRKINHDFFFTLIRCSGEMSEKSTLFITGKKKQCIIQAEQLHHFVLIKNLYIFQVRRNIEVYRLFGFVLECKFKYPFQIEVLPVSCLQLKYNKIVNINFNNFLFHVRICNHLFQLQL